MTTTHKKPGTRPGKDKSPPKRTTAAQRAIHRRIDAESAATLAAPPRAWHPEEVPELHRLISAARAEAIARRRLRGRMVFNHEGRRYAARFTSLDRVIVECWVTGRFIASSGYLAL